MYQSLHRLGGFGKIQRGRDILDASKADISES